MDLLVAILDIERDLRAAELGCLGTDLLERLVTWQNSASRLLVFGLGGKLLDGKDF